MSSLNLEPNIQVIAVQAGFFLTNLVIVKKLMLEPFLKVQKSRSAVTTQVTAAAIDLKEKNAALLNKLEESLASADKSIFSMTQEIFSQAGKSKDQIIQKSEKGAREDLNQLQKTIQSSLEEQSKLIPEIARNLASEAFAKVVR